MRRWPRVLLTIVAALALLLALNAIVLDRQTKSAEANVEGGEVLSLSGGDLQVLESMPAASSASRPGAAGSAEPPIVLLNCFTCSINWWDELTPALLRAGHRVIAIDLLGHGGSEKPASGYEIEEQAQLVAQALGQLDVEQPVVVGHSLGGAVAVALAELSPQLVDGIVIVDSEPDASYGELGLLARATVTPVIGEALWRLKADSAIRAGLEEVFAPDYDVPDQFVEDVRQMTYSSYDESHAAFDSYTSESPLDARLRALDVSLLAIFGAEEQIADPRESLSAYAGVGGAQTALVQGAGHSPNVEKPLETARLITRFADSANSTKAGPAAGGPTTASDRPTSPNQPCDRQSKSGQGSGARRDGESAAPESLPARCRNASTTASPEPNDPDPQAAPGPGAPIP